MAGERTSGGGPGVEGDALVFRVDDPGAPDGTLAGVRLWQEVRLPAQRCEFASVEGGWELRLPLPPVTRLEYLLELRHHDGSARAVLDPANPHRVRGVFGDKSVVELPGYQAPAWLTAPRARTVAHHVAPRVRPRRYDIPACLVVPADAHATERRCRCWSRTTGRSSPTWPT